MWILNCVSPLDMQLLLFKMKYCHTRPSAVGCIHRCGFSVATLCPSLCDPMNYSMPSFPVLTISWNLLRLIPLSQWGYLTISSSVASCSCPKSFPASGSFPVSQLFTSGGQSIGVSASASVLPVNIQGWFPLGVTGLISLQSSRFSRVFSSTTIQKHQFFST